MKKQTFHTLFVVLIILIFSSCKSIEKTTVKTKDTNTLNERVVSYKDTVIPVKMEATGLTIDLLEIVDHKTKDSLLFKQGLNTIKKTFKNQSGRSKVTVQINKGKIKADCECDSISIRAQLRSELIKQIKTTNQTVIDKETKKKGVSLFRCISYCVSSFCAGFAASKLLTTLKII